jgi:sialic acid synthase
MNLPAYLIAECCCNHAGDFELAKKMIDSAVASGADCAKFQKRCIKELLTPEQYSSPHPNPRHSFGGTYGEHRDRLEFSIQQHVKLAEHCKQCGIGYSTSVWDLTSAKEVVDFINPRFIKVPSACNNNYQMLEYLVASFKGDLHVSTGMTTWDEYARLLQILPKDRTVIYHCTSGYPVPFEQLFLEQLLVLRQNWIAVGFSGHHRGIAVDIAAYTLGATFIERHFTLDRTAKGTDNAFSLEVSGMTKLARDLRAVFLSLGSKCSELSPVEVEQRCKLKYRGSCQSIS